MQFLKEAAGIVRQYYSYLLTGVGYTMLLALVGTVAGFCIGLLTGVVRTAPKSRNAVLRTLHSVVNALIAVYIEVFRSTPMMVQAVFLYYGLKSVFNWTPVVAGICIISINTGAYMAEILRSGIQSVDVGQTEAARSIGMTSAQTMLHVVLPQGIKNAFPAIGNEFVVNIKDSSVLNAISVTELFFQSNKIAGSIFDFTATFLVTALIYLILTFTTTSILHVIEKRMGRAPSSYPSSQTVPEARLAAGKTNQSRKE